MLIGDVYEGNWFDGRRHGKGVLKQHDGITYECQWEHDKKVGSGVKIVNGKRIEGTFYNDDFRDTFNKNEYPRIRVGSDGNIYDYGDYIGRIANDGRVYDSDGYLAGRIDDDGYIRDSDGYKIGKIELDDGRLKDKDGYYDGKIDNGVIKDGDGYYMGCYEGDRKGVAAFHVLLKK